MTIQENKKYRVARRKKKGIERDYLKYISQIKKYAMLTTIEERKSPFA